MSKSFEKYIKSFIHQTSNIQNSMRATFNVKQSRHKEKNREKFLNIFTFPPMDIKCCYCTIAASDF